VTLEYEFSPEIADGLAAIGQVVRLGT